MPRKYWCKTADGVEGPYEPQALKFIDGFSPDILVSPDIPEASETWSRFSEIAELQAVINQNPKAGLAPVVIQAHPPCESGAISRPEGADQPIVEAAPPTMEVPKDEFAASTEMLDLMQKISREMEHNKVEAPAPAQVREADLLKIKNIRRQLKESRRPALVAAVILVMAGLTFLAVKTNAPKQWFNLIATKFHKVEKMPAAAPAAQAPAPVAKAKLEPSKPVLTPVVIKTPPKKPAVKKEPETTQKPAAPEKEKTLATQKFYLPGVPSPKLTSSKIDPSSPLPQAKEEAPPIRDSGAISRPEGADAPADDEEEKVNYGKSSKGSGNEDWKKQASWGD